jgi:hypothetical protein
MPLPDISLIHDRYLALCLTAREHFGETLAGKLLLRTPFDAEGAAMAIAASVAGAATLCVDADTEALRQGLRSGLCDFVVAHLDEALRILKNEIRRGLPVSVCLSANPEECVEAMAERGVQPDLLALAAGEMMRGAQLMVECGALRLAGGPEPEAGTSLLRWSVTVDPARTMPRVAAITMECLDPANATTPARRRWIDLSPRYLGRAFARQQCVRMTPGEAAAFEVQVRAAAPAVTIGREGDPPA